MATTFDVNGSLGRCIHLCNALANRKGNEPEAESGGQGEQPELDALDGELTQQFIEHLVGYRTRVSGRVHWKFVSREEV